jgi:putative hydrolase of the HAD superfamily
VRRRAAEATPGAERGTGGGPIRAVTFDFGNTLVPVDRAALRDVVQITATQLADRLGPFAVADVLDAWADERERQFREELPRFREVDLGERFVRVLARLRGMAPPPPEVPWDQDAAARLSTSDEIDWSIEIYSAAFVRGIPPRPWVAELLASLARERRLAIVSNWPLAVTVDRYAAAAGWDRHLAAIVVSQRVGTIKPHPGIFRAAEAALGIGPTERASILHVGDDWAADVVGARNAGWRAAFLHVRPADSPLPTSDRDDTAIADLELASLAGLETALRDGTTTGPRYGIRPMAGSRPNR